MIFAKMPLNIYFFTTMWMLFSHKCVVSKAIQKRQLYREQVLPHLGGKIPDSAFHTDRLALNQLQKIGIAIPDGVILEQRNPEVYQYTHKAKRPVYKVTATDDKRYTPKEGRYKSAKSLETTYPIPHIAQLKEHNLINRPAKKQLAIPHSLNKGHQRPIPFNRFHHPTIGHQKDDTGFLQYWPYGDFDLFSNLQYYPFFYENFNQKYFIGPSIFNDFATFFDSHTHP